jgi:Tfp pilus assembly protein PilF
MKKLTERNGLVILAMLAALALAVFATACTDTEPTTTSVAASATTSSTMMQMILDGDQVQQYADASAQAEAELPDLEKAVEASPTDLAALQNLASAQWLTKKYEAAAATYEKMLQIKEDAVTRNNYGNVLRDWKTWDKAKVQYQKAIADDPTYSTAYINLAVILVSESDTKAAVALLDQGISATTGDDKASLETYKTKLTSESSPTTT